MQKGGDNFNSFAEESSSAQDQIGHDSEQTDMPGLIRSGDSSPGLRDMSADGPALSPADKKRNKLGYHRTAVACGQYLYTVLPRMSLSNNLQDIVDGERSDAYLLLTTRVPDVRTASA